MPSWLFPLFLFAVWCLWAVAAAAQKSVAEAARGVPEKERRGVSILPVIPGYPLAFWGIAWLIDRVYSPAGTWIVGTFHALFAVVLVVSIVRDRGRLNKMDAQT
jgi:hypothetical protein